MTKRPASMPQKPDRKERAGEVAICLLYLFFFCIWAAGYWLGLSDFGGVLFGLPVWFVFSCLFSFGAVFLALLAVNRYFFK